MEEVAKRRTAKDGKPVGQTADQTFQVGVRKTVDASKDTLWNLLGSADGMEIWLGKLVDPGSDDPNAYRTSEGISGKFTVVNQGSHYRMTWQPPEWARNSVLQIRVLPKGAHKAVLSFHQEGMPSAEVREHMKSHWAGKIDQLINLLNDPSGH